MKEHLGLLEFDDWHKLMVDNDENRSPQPDDMAPGTEQTSATRPIRSKTATEEEIQQYEQTRPDQVLDDGMPNNSDHKYNPAISDDKRALDPLSDQFYYNIWRRTANKNTLVYRDLFRCVPDDTVTTFTKHRQFLPSVPHGHVADPSLSEQDIRKKLANIQGHLVEFPTDYLKDENMLGSYIRETVTPMVIFT